MDKTAHKSCASGNLLYNLCNKQNKEEDLVSTSDKQSRSPPKYTNKLANKKTTRKALPNPLRLPPSTSLLHLQLPNRYPLSSITLSVVQYQQYCIPKNYHSTRANGQRSSSAQDFFMNSTYQSVYLCTSCPL